MKSKIFQLMLLAGALTVSFVAQAAEVTSNFKSAESAVNARSAHHDTDKNTDANVYGHVIDRKTSEQIGRAHV